MTCVDHERAIKTGAGDGVPQFDENDLSQVRHVIGVVSGKGGVGKSLVTGTLATELARRGFSVGVLDADITGPSIPKMFGMSGEHAMALGHLLLPNVSKGGIKVMSTNLILDDEETPVLWRSPMLVGAIRQFWSETSWGPLDYLLVDMPPGTGDVALTVFQSLPIEGIVIVSTPQDLVRMVVGKAVRMAENMDVPIIGLVENMSYVVCPDCGKHIEVFGKSHVGETAEAYGIDLIGRLPIDPKVADACDRGAIEDELPQDLLPEAIAAILALDDKPAAKKNED